MSLTVSTGLFIFISGCIFGWIGQLTIRYLPDLCRRESQSHIANESVTHNDRKITERYRKIRKTLRNKEAKFRYAHNAGCHRTLDQISGMVVVVGPVTISATTW